MSSVVFHLLLQTQATPRRMPKKGGRAIHPADVAVRAGHLTPMQVHRILSSLQQSDAAWSVDRIASAYDVDARHLENMRQHLTLPFIEHDDADDDNAWQGTRTEPARWQVQRELGMGVSAPAHGGVMGGQHTIDEDAEETSTK